MRDLKADLKSIQEGRTLFDDPDPSVGTKYELYEVAEHAIERAIEAETLNRELIDVLDVVLSEDSIPMSKWLESKEQLKVLHAKAKGVLGDE